MSGHLKGNTDKTSVVQKAINRDLRSLLLNRLGNQTSSKLSVLRGKSCLLLSAFSFSFYAERDLSPEPSCFMIVNICTKTDHIL